MNTPNQSNNAVRTGEAAHTPTPWKAIDRWNGELTLSAESGPVAVVDADRPAAQNQANAAYIVRAVNSHAALVEALEITVSRFEWLAKHNATESQAPWIDVSLLEARAALKLAKGEQA